MKNSVVRISCVSPKWKKNNKYNHNSYYCNNTTSSSQTITMEARDFQQRAIWQKSSIISIGNSQMGGPFANKKREDSLAKIFINRYKYYTRHTKQARWRSVVLFVFCFVLFFSFDFRNILFHFGVCMSTSVKADALVVFSINQLFFLPLVTVNDRGGADAGFFMLFSTFLNPRECFQDFESLKPSSAYILALWYIYRHYALWQPICFNTLYTRNISKAKNALTLPLSSPCVHTLC